MQEPADPRQHEHDLSDAFAIAGPQSQANVIGNISTNAMQKRTDDGFSCIGLEPSSHHVKIMVPGGFKVESIAF